MFQEKEIHRHRQLYTALWGLPNWSCWPSGISCQSSLTSLIFQTVVISFNESNVQEVCCNSFNESNVQEAVEHAKATGHVNFQEYR